MFSKKSLATKSITANKEQKHTMLLCDARADWLCDASGRREPFTIDICPFSLSSFSPIAKASIYNEFYPTTKTKLSHTFCGAPILSPFFLAFMQCDYTFCYFSFDFYFLFNNSTKVLVDLKLDFTIAQFINNTYIHDSNAHIQIKLLFCASTTTIWLRYILSVWSHAHTPLHHQSKSNHFELFAIIFVDIID